VRCETQGKCTCILRENLTSYRVISPHSGKQSLHRRSSVPGFQSMISCLYVYALVNECACRVYVCQKDRVHIKRINNLKSWIWLSSGMLGRLTYTGTRLQILKPAYGFHHQGDIWNVGKLFTYYMAKHPRRQSYSRQNMQSQLKILMTAETSKSKCPATCHAGDKGERSMAPTYSWPRH
jgi:hypothetical protein